MESSNNTNSSKGVAAEKGLQRNPIDTCFDKYVLRNERKAKKKRKKKREDGTVFKDFIDRSYGSR